ncbi:hypothetical protein DQ04_00421140 [Trypanosoma grayi]|uniref:hypothetical protein n=1 Tax=Trypanosoma grayi TaxID=71804 RepID=UPI0004F4A6EB|nr:hypothetical protein DQ04_00421140 [Trypanosoma grayi]KEG14535.1 hypothetical protein DQ04_00421140 [Trypanosoma grayi]
MGNSTREGASTSSFQAGPPGRPPLGRDQLAQVLPPLKTSANEVAVIAAPSDNPYVTALASEANRIAKGIWTHSAWEQRVSIMRRFCDFTKRNDLEVREENVPLFIVSLQLTKSSAVQYTRTLLTLLASGRSPAWMFLAGLQRKAAADPIKRARPMERWELDLISDILTLENDRVALRLAWVTASRWGEIALLQNENFIPHPQTKEAPIVDGAPSQRHSKPTPTERHDMWTLVGTMQKGQDVSPREWWRGTAHNVNHKRHGKCTPPLRHDSAFHKKRGTGACSRSSD